MWWLWFSNLFGGTVDRKADEKIYDSFAATIEKSDREYDDILHSINEQLKSFERIHNEKYNPRPKTRDVVNKAREHSRTVDYTNDIIFCQNFLEKRYNRFKRNPDSIRPKLRVLSNARLLVMRAIVTEYLKEKPNDRVLKNIRNMVLIRLREQSINQRKGRVIFD